MRRALQLIESAKQPADLRSTLRPKPQGALVAARQGHSEDRLPICRRWPRDINLMDYHGGRKRR